IETEFLEIVLIDLDELRLDRDLPRLGRIGLINQRIHHIQIVLRVPDDQCSTVRPEGCACPGWKRNAHAFQHGYCVRSPNELAIVLQSLPRSGGALHLICLARRTDTVARSRGSLETDCLLLNDVLRHRWRLSNSSRRASSLLAPTRYVSSDVVTHI